MDHDFSCQQSEAANNSNLKSYWLLPDTVNGLLVPFLRAEICSLLLISACLPISSWADGCQEPAAEAVRSTLDWQMNMMYFYTAFTLILSVIIPHTKHASSLAIAATATFLALPCLINL